MTATSGAKVTGQKLKENFKNEGNLIPPKKYNNFLLTRPQNIEIYDLINEKKIAILSNFNDLKEIEKYNSTKSEELYMKKIRSFRNRYKSL